MAGPSNMVKKNIQRPPKKQRQISETGEEFGLVPPKFLKRKTALEPDATPTRKPNRSLSDPPTGGTPPRKAPASLTPPETPSRLEQENAGVLKDTSCTIISNTPQERLVAIQELNRVLYQRGFQSITSPFVEDWKATVLRAEGWNINKATGRVLQQWRLKSEFFGTPDLKVTMGDIAPNLVQAGMIQLVPTRDLSGRAIVCMKFSADQYSSQEREIKKYLFYILASALEDEETQDKGVVLCVWNPQDSANPFKTASSSWGMSLFDSFWNLWKTVKPAFRIARLHYMTIEGEAPYFVKEYEEGETLVRHHSGSAQECLHALLTYGMPLPSLPFSPLGILHTSFHSKWVEWRQRTDSYHHQRNYQIVLVPNRHDVLFGKHSVINAGNVRFHQMILGNIEEYCKSKASEQAAMRTQLFKSLTVPMANGEGTPKCLQPLDTRQGILWEPMDEAAATAKIADAFDFVSRQLKQSKENNDNDGDPVLDPHAAWEWYTGMTDSCCFIVTCNKEGICGGSSRLSKDGYLP